VDEAKVPAAGVRFRCKECRAVFYAYPPAGGGPEDEARVSLKSGWAVWTAAGVQEDLDLAQVRERVREKRLQVSDSVRVPGTEEWLVAGQVPEIKRLFLPPGSRPRAKQGEGQAGRASPPAAARPQAFSAAAAASQTCTKHPYRGARWACLRCNTHYCEPCMTYRQVHDRRVAWCEQCGERGDQVAALEPAPVAGSRSLASLRTPLIIIAAVVVVFAALGLVFGGSGKRAEEAEALALYQEAAEAMAAGDYARASEQLNPLLSRYPDSRAAAKGLTLKARARRLQTEAELLASGAGRRSRDRGDQGGSAGLSDQDEEELDPEAEAWSRRHGGRDPYDRCCCQESALMTVREYTEKEGGSMKAVRRDWQVQGHSWEHLISCDREEDCLGIMDCHSLRYRCVPADACGG